MCAMWFSVKMKKKIIWMKFRKKTYARGYMYIMRQNMKHWLLTYKHSAYVKQISGRRCWIARIIYDYFYLIEDAYALVEIISS